MIGLREWCLGFHPVNFGGCTMSEMADFCVGSVIVLAFLWWSSLS